MKDRQKILIVDDRKENLKILKHVLKNIDVDVIEADNGKDALASALEHDIDLAILDVNMPEMNGYELSEKLRNNKKTETIPVLFLTATYDDEMHIKQGFDSGAVDYVVKPYKPNILLGKIVSLLRISQEKSDLEKSCENLKSLIRDKVLKPKILIVDDKKENLVALRHVLEDVDAELVEATSGNDALAATLDNDFALALLDVQMPEMNGYELAEFLRMDERTQSIPVIFLTANSTEEEYIFKGYEVGAVDYITKPYQPETLRSKVKVFLEISRYKSELETYSGHLENLVNERTYNLREKVKEISCLLQISRLMVNTDALSDELIKSILLIIPTGWQYPEITCVRITVNEKEYSSKNFKETEWKLSSEIVISGKVIGLIEVFYLDKKPDIDIGPFLREEQEMITNIARQLGLLIERQKNNDLIRKTENKHLKMLANIGDVIVIIDKDGINRYKSPNIEKWFGWKPEEVVGKKALKNVHLDDLEVAQEFIENLIKKPGKTGTHECRYKCKDGSYKWIQFTGVNLLNDPDIKGILGNYHDITERKEAELNLIKAKEEAEKSEEKLKIAFGSMNDAIFISDTEGRFIDFNEAFATFHKFKNKEECKKSLNEFHVFLDVHDLDGELVPLEMWVVSKALRGETGSEEEYVLKHKNTGESWVGIYSYSPIRNNKGDITGSVTIARDITHRKQAAKDKLKLEDQLRQSQKMEAVGQLAGGIAHDFNNMLAVINGYSEMLLMDFKPSDTQYKRINEIFKAGKRSEDLTRQLLAFARKQTIDPKILDLNDTITGMLKILKRLIGENINLQYEASEHAMNVEMDPSQIDQILTNLIINARDAISEVGNIKIHTSLEELDEDFCSNNPDLSPGKYVALVISDDGCGMDQETVSKIFDPFFTTKAVGQGTGLGLATVFGIVKQNKGNIIVNSDLGSGTEFRIYIPYKEFDKKKVEGEKSSDLVRGTETILLVEDEITILEFASEMIGQLGYNVISADNPMKAIKLVEEYDSEIHLIITDVIMPAMSGRDLRDKISSLMPGIKCLYISGYTADIISKGGKLDEDIIFLPKPFTTKDMSEKIREALES